MKRRVVEMVVSMRPIVGHQIQDVHDIVKSRTTGQSTNENACFSSNVFQSKCIKSMSASDTKKEMNDLIAEFDTLFSVKITITVLERYTIAIFSRHLKAHNYKGRRGPNASSNHDLGSISNES